MTLTLRQLQQIQALNKHRNFRLAANELHISQPALSRALQTVEEALGSPLFDRMRSGIEPTLLGELVLEKGAIVLREASALENDMAGLLGLQTGRLSIAAGPYPGDHLLPSALARLTKLHPDILCSLREIVWSDGPELLLSGQVDLVFADYDAIEQDPRFDIDPMLNDRFFYICRSGHPLTKVPEVSLATAALYPLVSNRAPPRFSHFFTEGASGRFNDDGTVFLPKIEAPTFGGARVILKESDCLSMAPLSVAYRDIKQGELAILRTPTLPLFMRSGLVTLRGRTQSPLTAALREEIRALLRMECKEVSLLASELGLKGWRAELQAS